MKMTNNMKAFLDMLAFSEGTINIGDNGYNVIVGGATFTGYADHPRKLVSLPKLGIKSTAAGRYQVLARYFNHYKSLLSLPDFSPESQDRIAVQLIRERGAFVLVNEGKVAEAIDRVKNIWASLPGAGYGQHEHRLDKLVSAYRRYGGTVA